MGTAPTVYVIQNFTKRLAQHRVAALPWHQRRHHRRCQHHIHHRLPSTPARNYPLRIGGDYFDRRNV